MTVIKKIEKKVLSVPVFREAELFNVKITSPEGFLLLQIPAVPPEKAECVSDYLLPCAPENAFIESEEAFFDLVSWKDFPTFVHLRDTHPEYHFSPASGWINDPTGLYFLNGTWHLFAQHNPFGAKWGNMHWLHAESEDLLHWRQTGIALYPDSRGTMFSGGAVIDEKNVSGLGENAVLLYYTNAHYRKGSTQELAYSTDGGKHFLKYEKNPLIPDFTGMCDRDPNIVFDPDSNIWRMALYLGNEDKREFILLSSKNLLDWTKTDSYFIPGGRECPGIRRMRDEISGQWKWIFTEANCFYRVGSISPEGKVTFESDSRRFFYGNAYAGQMFFNAPENKTVFIAWLRSGVSRGGTFNGTMTLPMEFHLRGGELLVLPYAFPREKAEIFECSGKTTFVGGGRKIEFDLLAHSVCADGEKSFAIPPELSSLRGSLFRDACSLEFFDDSGRFAFAFRASF